MGDTHRRRRFWYLGRTRDRVAADVDEELRVHLEMRAEELRAAGLSSDAASREAIRQFGDLEATRQYCRTQDEGAEARMRRGLIVEELIQDLRISIRGLLRAPVMTLTIVVTVGLGIGATTVIFGAINAALLRPLPYAHPDQLVRIYTDSAPNRFPFSVADYLALTAQQTQFEGIASFASRPMVFSDGTVAERVRARSVSWTYFDVLGLRPAAGRGFEEADGRRGSPPAAIVSHGFWQQRLGGRPDAIGSAIRLDGQSYTVVGILPRDVGPLEATQDLFVAGRYETPPRKGPFFMVVVGRLRDGGSRAAAAEELHAINRRIFPLWKSSYQDDRATWSMIDLKSYIVGDVGTIAGLALTAVALVWLIACGNASSLLIARVTSRRRELAVRAALGASRSRVVRYLLAESCLLALGAAAVGIALAWVGVGLVRDFGAAYFPRSAEIAIDGPVRWLLVATTALSALLFGLVPAVHGSGGPVEETLRASGRSATGGLGARRLRRALVAAQFAIATPLLVVAGLLLASLNELGRVDLGFDTRNLLSGSIQLPAAQYTDAGQIVSFWDELQRRLAALPGVDSVTFANGRPPAEINDFNNFDLEDFPAASGQSQPVTPWVAVTPDYFRVFGLSLQEGRLLDEADVRRTDIQPIVVDRAWARRFFPRGSAIGKRLHSGGCTSCPWTVVVGVVSDVKYAGLDKPDDGSVYQSVLPQNMSRFAIVRTKTDTSRVLTAVRQTLHDLDASVPFSNAATMEELIDRSLQRPRSLSVLVASFAAVALLLSLVGIYGVMAYYVQQHAKDISIRLALGGRRADVLQLIVGQGMRVVSGGVAIGLVAAAVGTRFIASLLFGVGAADVRIFAAVSVLLVSVALAACLLPAQRATRVEPAAVLREE
ncbi:MAG TPA: ABC transporter permease [Vicinamibacterales bacterium]|nr:ABC transporter permease [Vicinamibacterales bacterium]